MGKIVVSEFVTLDGVMEAPGGEPSHPHTGWVIPHMGPEQMAYKLDEILEAESHLLGRTTYESFAGAWPYRDGEFAEKINAMPKYVVSTDLKASQSGPLLVAGSRTLVHFLFENDLVDELRLMIFPVILGSGAKLFPETPKKQPLKLLDTRTFPTGVIVQTYTPSSESDVVDLSMAALCADPVRS
jgi:dihydrofolate reductase